jgi:hypothetical protein
MRWTEARLVVRVIKFRSVLGCYESTELNRIEEAELLSITERTFRRWCVRFGADGEAGLLDRRLGKASPKRVPRDSEQKIERLYRTLYQGFTAKYFHEHLVRDHQFTHGYTLTKAPLHSRGLLEHATHPTQVGWVLAHLGVSLSLAISAAHRVTSFYRTASAGLNAH